MGEGEATLHDWLMWQVVTASAYSEARQKVAPEVKVPDMRLLQIRKGGVHVDSTDFAGYCRRVPPRLARTLR